jgi:ABC-type amino acid transport system permease subunit
MTTVHDKTHLDEIAVQNVRKNKEEVSLVPMGFTIGLALFALVLSLAGYGFRLAVGDDLNEVLRHAAMIVPAFVIGVPLLFWLGSLVFNKLMGATIQRRNALTLGWLTACVAMLWLMGTYS